MEKTLIVCEDKSHDLFCKLSFTPLIKHLKERRLADTNSATQDLDNLLEEIFLTPGFTDPVDDQKSDYAKLVENILLLTYPTSKDNLELYAVAAPFSSLPFYASAGYQNLFSIDSGNTHNMEDEAGTVFFNAKLHMAYELILSKYYGLEELHDNTFIYPVINQVSGVKRFLEIELLTSFIEVKLTGILPDLEPAHLSQLFRQKGNNAYFVKELPLSIFSFEGALIIKIRDVTARESINNIKNILLVTPYFDDTNSCENIQEQMRNLAGLPDIKICITSQARNTTQGPDNPTMDQYRFLSHLSHQVKDDSPEWLHLENMFSQRCCLLLTGTADFLFHKYPFLQSYMESGVKSLVMYPLRFDKELLGVLSVVSTTDGRLTPQEMVRWEAVVPLFELALGRQSEKMDDEVDRVIKEQFTAVQASVNWKFTEAARKFITQKNNGQECKIDNIVFDDVYPLYGSIDVRNSSVERSIALQKDLLDQLLLVDAIIRKAKREIYLFSLQEISYRIEKYLKIASIVLFPGDEMAIQNFLDEEIAQLFDHLKKAVPALQADIEHYFLSLHTDTRKMSRQCKAFEESIAMINNELVKFINQEQAKVQKIYAHYFEYFVTDGVDFNIYMGQSITPDKPFDHFYLKTLKLWQLTTLVKAARKVRSLQDTIPVALDTTQLILAHGKPLSISFRSAERKFDVDGAYNIHYEIIKKRIDKIKILDSCERLTQPGKIAIVFAQNKEAQEYTSYIEFLQNEGLLEGGIEYYDLEDLPGVRGLKALRVSINMESIEVVRPLLATNYQLPVTG